MDLRLKPEDLNALRPNRQHSALAHEIFVTMASAQAASTAEIEAGLSESLAAEVAPLGCAC